MSINIFFVFLSPHNEVERSRRMLLSLGSCCVWLSVHPRVEQLVRKHKTPTQLIIAPCALPRTQSLRLRHLQLVSPVTSCTRRCLCFVYMFTNMNFRESFHVFGWIRCWCFVCFSISNEIFSSSCSPSPNDLIEFEKIRWWNERSCHWIWMQLAFLQLCGCSDRMGFFLLLFVCLNWAIFEAL